MDFEAIKKAAQGYQADMTRFLRDMIAIPSESCEEKGECLRRKLNIPSGTKQEICFAVHAEQNAIIQAAKYGINVNGATLYCTHQPCVICAKMIINAGISRVVYKNGYPDDFSLKLFEEANVKVEKYRSEEIGDGELAKN